MIQVFKRLSVLHHTCVSGIPTEKLREELKDLKGRETDPEEGKIFAYVYTQEGDHFDIQTEAFAKFQGR